ncbi:MAG: cyclase family protein [Actinomycetota bacterium]
MIDITVPLGPDTNSWVEMDPPRQDFFLDMRRGDRVTGSTWEINTHHGTHLDAPSHVAVDGADIEGVDIAACMGPCVLVQVDGEDNVTRADLEARAGELEGHTRVLIKTPNSERIRGETRFHPDYVALEPSAAEYLVERGFRLVGIDYQSVDDFETLVTEERSPVHDILLGSECLVLEGTDLRRASPGEYVLLALPLRLQEGEGSPVRAVLLDPDTRLSGV